MDIDIGLSVYAINCARLRKGRNEARIVPFQGNCRSFNEMRDQTPWILVTDGDPYRGWGNAGLGKRCVRQFGVAGERRAKNNRAGLTQADLQPECRLQAVEQLLDMISSNPEGIVRPGFEVNRKKWGRQAEKQVLLSHRGIWITSNTRAVDIDPRVSAEHIGKNLGVDRLSKNAKWEGSHAIQNFESLIGIEKSTFYIVDVPEQRLVPVPSTRHAIRCRRFDRLALGNEHSLIAPDANAGGGRARAGNVLGKGVNQEIRTRHRIGMLQQPLQEGRADGRVANDIAARLVGGSRDARNIQGVAMRIAR